MSNAMKIHYSDRIRLVPSISIWMRLQRQNIDIRTEKRNQITDEEKQWLAKLLLARFIASLEQKYLK